MWAGHSRNEQSQPGPAKWLEVAGKGAMGLSSVLVVSWVPQFCLLESGKAKLFFHASDAWEGKAATARTGWAQLLLAPAQPLYMASVGFLTLRVNGLLQGS